MKDDLTLSQKVEKYFADKLNSGYKINSKIDAVTLKKMAMKELEIPQGSKMIVNDGLRRTMETLNLKVPDEIAAKNLVGSVKAKLIKFETAETPQDPVIPQQPTPTGAPAQIPQQKTGTPLNVNLTPEQLAAQQANVVTPTMAASYEAGLKHVFGGLMKFYAKTGFIEVEDVKPKDEPMKLGDYIKETDELAHNWSDYCLRNNVKLPKIFEFAMLLITSLIVLGSPFFTAIFFNRGKKEKAKKTDLGHEGDNKHGEN